MNILKRFGLMLIFVLLLSACQPADVTETPPAKEGDFNYGQNATVESLEVILLESFPLKAQAIVSGYLPDGCTELDEIGVEREGQEFILTVTTRRPTGDVMCTQALVPFEETVDLDIRGLEAGTYTVIAQEEQTTFTLDVDNVIPDVVEEADFDYGADARVEELTVNVMESDPVQVSVVLEGYLPDGCTEIDQITSAREQQTFIIEIGTRRPAGDVMCTQQIVPFEEVLNLDVENLEAGAYTVQVGEMNETFQID
jgi:inhibitor of cysteine peptidase